MFFEEPSCTLEEILYWRKHMPYEVLEPEEACCMAAYHGNAVVLRGLLKRHGNALAVAKSEDGLFPIHYAAANGSVAVIQLLLHASASAKTPTCDGYAHTPLRRLLQAVRWEDALDRAETLVKACDTEGRRDAKVLLETCLTDATTGFRMPFVVFLLHRCAHLWPMDTS